MSSKSNCRVIVVCLTHLFYSTRAKTTPPNCSTLIKSPWAWYLTVDTVILGTAKLCSTRKNWWSGVKLFAAAVAADTNSPQQPINQQPTNQPSTIPSSRTDCTVTVTATRLTLPKPPPSPLQKQKLAILFLSATHKQFCSKTFFLHSLYLFAIFVYILTIIINIIT